MDNFTSLESKTKKLLLSAALCVWAPLAIAAPLSFDLDGTNVTSGSLSVSNGVATAIGTDGVELIGRGTVRQGQTRQVDHVFSQRGLALSNSLQGDAVGNSRTLYFGNRSGAFNTYSSSNQDALSLEFTGLDADDYLVTGLGLHVEGDPVGAVSFQLSGLTGLSFMAMPARPGNTTGEWQTDLDLAPIYAGTSPVPRGTPASSIISIFPEFNTPNRNGFWIRSVTLMRASELFAPVVTTPVPLPSGMMLMLPALGGFVALRRRRRSS